MSVTQPIMTDEKVRARAQHFRHLKRDEFYKAFTGWVQGALLDREMSDAERVADIQLSLNALDLALAETSARSGIAAADDKVPTTCPTCGSNDPADLLMTGCGFKCDDPSRWHVAAKKAPR